jgi:hypothetical protein
LDSKPISVVVEDDPAVKTTNEWAKTTVLSRLTSRPLASFASHIEKIYDRVAANRAAMIRLEIISYRIEHRQLPEKLIDLGGTLNGNQLVDPFSNRPFEYYPAFLLSAGTGDQSIRPTSSTDAELISRNSPMVKFTIDQLTSSEPNRVASVIDLLSMTRPSKQYLYSIPPLNPVSKFP